MHHIVDLHIHSRFARACSKELTLANIDKYCRFKGVHIIATGDFTHPAWFSEIERDLEPSNEGLYKLNGGDNKVNFVLATELSCIYKQDGKVRRIHVCLMTPTIDSVKRLILELERRGCNLRADGRPILGISVSELTRICFDIEPRMYIWPAHIWTPWFAMFGSKSGFDTVEACFGDMTQYIHAIETGLSSDPQMNWRVSQLDNYSIISNSDAHSLRNIAREANMFALPEVTYTALCDAITKKDPKVFLKTIEFYPEEGMYHYDGHRDCEISISPSESRKLNGLCPKCNNKLTLGVMYRVNELADRSEDYNDPNRVPFVKLVELDKIIAESLGIKSRTSKKVVDLYTRLIKDLGPELEILLSSQISDISKVGGERLGDGIARMRDGHISISCGYDGVYGKVNIFNDNNEKSKKQNSFL